MFSDNHILKNALKKLGEMDFNSILFYQVAQMLSVHHVIKIQLHIVIL